MERRRILIIGGTHSLHHHALLLLLASLGHDAVIAEKLPPPSPEDMLRKLAPYDMEPLATAPIHAEALPTPAPLYKRQLPQGYGANLPRWQGPPRPAARGLLCRG